MNDMLICPHCLDKLTKTDKYYTCKNNHTFDIASSGYVNLNTKNVPSGDSKDMVRARTRFLDAGYYSEFAEAVAAILEKYPHENIIDAGCGEGYYSEFVSNILKDANILGFDLSKNAVEKAAKRARAACISQKAHFFVGGIFDMPVKDESIDAVINLFAPCAEEEFYRVLKPGGIILMGVAGRDHLLDFKKAIYDEVYLNSPEKVILSEKFELTERKNITYNIQITSNQAVNDLFSMTPYFWKTSEKDRTKLDVIERLETKLDFEILVFKKK